MIDPNAAWKDAVELRSYELDQGISQSQVLYFISTTDGFEIPKSFKAAKEGPKGQESSSAYCYDHEGCAKLSLTGFCCPAPSGSNLGCCDSFDQSADKDEVPQNPESASQSLNTAPASCLAHDKCVALGLTELCCPPAHGANLLCCNSLDAAESQTTGSVKETAHSQNDNESAPTSSRAASASCSASSGCAAQGLTGLCCPTAGGAYLSCCDVSA